VRAERLHVEHLEPRALRGGDDQIERRQVGVGEDLLLDEAAVGALQPGDGAPAVAVVGDGVVQEQPARHEVMGEHAEVAVQLVAPDVLHHPHRGHGVPPLVGGSWR
jgi:hypothetical protein